MRTWRLSDFQIYYTAMLTIVMLYMLNITSPGLTYLINGNLYHLTKGELLISSENETNACLKGKDRVPRCVRKEILPGKGV